jgi:hypothetical protein
MVEMARPASTWRQVAAVSGVVISAAVFWAPDPDASLRSRLALHDLGHVAAFGMVAALLAYALSAGSPPTARARAGVIWLAAGAALALGVIVELVQVATGRGGDPWDVVRDGGGAFCAALALAVRDAGLSAKLRAALAGTAIFTLLACAYPLVAALYDETRAHAQFPVLASFETTSDLSRFQFGEGMKPRIVPITDEDGRAASGMQLRLPPGRYPGFELSYFPRDWRGARALRLLIANPEPTPLELHVRIDDAKYDYRLDMADRYDRAFPLLPGTNRIEIPLSDVATAPRGRPFDLGRVQTVLVYAIDLEQARAIIVGPIVLLP